MVVISANTKPTGIRSTARSGKTNTQLEPVSSNQYGDSVSHPPITAPQAMEIMEKKLRFFFSLFGVSDIILDGLTSAQRIKQRFPDTIILLNTAYAEFEFARKAVEYGLNAYLLKPAEEEVILQTIDNCIRNNARIKDSPNGLSMLSVSKDSITHVTEYIDNNFNLPLTLDSLAEIAHFTPSYLSRIFHEKMGVTITEYITKKRIEKAEYLLIYTEASIQEIASRCGFSSTAHFHRIFKQKTDTTPLEYRHKHT